MNFTVEEFEKDGMTYIREKYENGSTIEFPKPVERPPQPQKPTSEQVQAQQLLELQKLNSKSDMINKALSTVLLGMQKGGK